MAANNTEDVRDLDLGDEPYESAEDEDFQLDDVADGSDISSEGEDEAAGPVKKKRKTEEKEEDAEELDSGDEVTIQKAKERKHKGKKSKGKGATDEDDIDFDDDEGGPGGFVRTRAMKMQMKEERKPLAKIDGATIDVDALWQKMNAPGTDSGLLPSQNEKKEPTPAEDNKDTEMENDVPERKQQTKYPDEFIKIKRTYKFAGEMITEEKIVPKESAEAKIFLANEGNADTLTAADVEDSSNAKAIKIRRPLRKLSRFDPNPTGTIQKSWEKRPATGIAEENVKGPKINTVEKSRLDWAAYVDQAGIKDELRVHSKAKEGYHGRMDFLDRVGAKQDEERRNARLRGM